MEWMELTVCNHCACVCAGSQGFETLDFLQVGLCLAVISIVYMSLTANFLLPKVPAGDQAGSDAKKARQFFCCFKLAPKSVLAGVTVTNSGLMATRDLRLVAIANKDSFIGADPDRCLMQGDV